MPNSDSPNILFILIDDLGKEWISCYGSASVHTPNIDHVAEGGMLFNNVWSMPQCTPSRVALLSWFPCAPSFQCLTGLMVRMIFNSGMAARRLGKSLV